MKKIKTIIRDRQNVKILERNSRSCHGGEAEWSLPTRNADGTWTPGEWMPPVEGDLEPCLNGYHVVSIEQLPRWLSERIFWRSNRTRDECRTYRRRVRTGCSRGGRIGQRLWGSTGRRTGCTISVGCTRPKGSHRHYTYS